MKSINVTVPLALGYKNEHIDIRDTDCNLEFEFMDGEHKITSEAIQIGTMTHFKEIPIMAQISITYKFDAKNNVLLLYGTDFSNENGILLTTFLKDSNEYCYQRVSACTIGKKDELYNPNWNHRTQLAPRLEETLVEALRMANERLMEAAKKLEGVTVLIKTPPPVLSDEEYKKYLAVYEDGKFLEFYNPGKHYDERHTVRGIESTWGGTVRFDPGENFANVIGSTNDPHIGGLSWIELWRRQFGNPTICTSYQYNGFMCNNHLVGGHVILGQQAKRIASGDNYVFIMPICSSHNNNDNVYMAALQYQDGIWLNNYMN